MDKSQISEDLYNALLDAKVGSRVLMSLNGSAQEGQPAETLVYVIDIEKTTKPLTRAEGKKIDQSKNPVTVKWADNGEPSISKPKGKAPKELESYTTIEGEGPKVKEGQNVAVHYSGWLWDDNSKYFDSSWQDGRGPFAVDPVGQAQVIDGWNEGLVGAKVGSQIVLVIPPDKRIWQNRAARRAFPATPPSCSSSTSSPLRAETQFAKNWVPEHHRTTTQGDTMSKQKPVVEFPGTEAPTELVIVDDIIGDGAEAASGHTVSVNYVGIAHSTGEEFDASYNRGTPLEFRLGSGMVISGWDQGIQGMKVGGRRTLQIPPHLAYGDQGAGGVIKPGESLIFVCDLEGVR